MNTNTVNISFRADLLKQIDNIAKAESRSRSELIREAARMYIEKKQKWSSIFTLGRDIVKANKIKEKDIQNEIKKQRKGD
ncbi:MAG: ribbon-helix-helix domain-containing protein [Candidatus Margulisbacteria bacterium]|nr:ribbon-helix-helix domain-containing protein [Candidatus Margulisiibacteriota bacterium]